jgi:hypothetical protein
VRALAHAFSCYNYRVPNTRDDRLTIIALACLAYIVQAVLHEGLGHAVTAWLSGAHQITISTVALQSDISSRLISASGTLVNLFFAGIFWLLLLNPGRYKPTTRYFFVLLMAGNLFTGTGYFLFSGVMNFGDWAAVISGFNAHWLWRLGLIIIGIASYYASMMLVAAHLRPFLPDDQPWRRVRVLAWTPYISEAVLAAIAGALNPAGLFYVIASALPSTLGANAGLLSLPSLMHRWSRNQPLPVGTIPRSHGWIAISVIACILFIGVLGGGLTFVRR